MMRADGNDTAARHKLRDIAHFALARDGLHARRAIGHMRGERFAGRNADFIEASFSRAMKW